MKNRQPSQVLGRALAQVGLKDDSPSARHEAVKLMAKWVDEVPEVRTALQTIADTDDKPTIRAAAAAAKQG